jgi:hypothetical protein
MSARNKLKATIAAIGFVAVVTAIACVGSSPVLPTTQCDGTDTYCGGACSNTQTDPRNCGACGKVCSVQNGETCQKGTCGPPCTGGTTRCGTVCLDVQSDTSNCGECGKKCGQGEACTQGKCVLLCTGGLTVCARAAAPIADASTPVDGATPTEAGTGDAGPGNASSSVCSDLQTDPNNCGMCGNVCPPEKSGCAQGKCAIGEFGGIRTNVAQDDLAPYWSECHSDLYNAVTPLATILQNKCTQGKLLLGCRAIGQKTLITAAEAPRADAIFDVGNGAQAFHLANGTAWYYSATWSWGYAVPNDGLSRNNCDTATGLFPDRRLCWHATGSSLQGGYRCGSIVNLNSSAQYERVIFQAP